MADSFTPPAWTPAPPPTVGAAPSEPPAPPPTRRRRGPLRITVGAGGAALIAVVVLLGLVRPGFFVQRVYDTAALQKGVLRVLQDDFQIGTETVACPARVPVEKGLRFSCNTLVGGAQQAVTVRVVDAGGRLEVLRPR